VLRSVICGRLRFTGLGCSSVSLVPHFTTDHRDRFHFVPAALQVKLPRDVALRSLHTIHGMIRTGPSGPSDDDANRRNLNPSNTFGPFVPSAIVTRHRTARAASTLRTTRRRELASIALHSQFHIPNSPFANARFHVLRCVLRYGPVSLRSIDQ
jgi:hypothetical protein